MAETQTLDTDIIDESKPITFTPLEWKFFKEELIRQFVDDDFDALKAIRRARYWQMQDRKTLKRINDLLKDIERNVVAKGIDRPERLKHEDDWSRRIDDKLTCCYFKCGRSFATVPSTKR